MGREASTLRAAGLHEKLGLLRDSARWSPERRAVWRRERIAELFAAARSAPGWRERLGGARALAEVEPLPREVLQRQGERLLTGAPGPTVAVRTSGSSGRPVRVEHDAATVGYEKAARLRHYGWFGLGPAAFAGLALPIHAAAASPPLRRRTVDPARFELNPWRLDRGTLGAVHAQMAAAGGVRLLAGIPSQLATLARLYRATGTDPKELRAELAIVGGEIVYSEDRRAVADVFGCAVTSIYGSMEARAIASECRAGSLHVNEEIAIVELLRPDGGPAAPGELGEVAVTLLHNHAQPLIRYRLGDMARSRPGSCPCGSSLERLEVHVARREQMVRRADGELMHPRFLRTIYERVLGDSLLGFHTVQEATGRFTAHVELTRPLPDGAADVIAGEVSAYMREPVEVRVAEGAAVRTVGGKLRTFTCAAGDAVDAPVAAR